MHETHRTPMETGAPGSSHACLQGLKLCHPRQPMYPGLTFSQGFCSPGWGLLLCSQMTPAPSMEWALFSITDTCSQGINPLLDPIILFPAPAWHSHCCSP